MDKLVKRLFEDHWRDVTVGPCIEGAVFEVRFSEPPKLTMLDGYLTVNLGPWHFHLCIAEHKGNGTQTQAAGSAGSALRDARSRCGGRSSWGVRIWNGFGEQMTTVFLPNPRLSDEMRPQKPDWSRLRFWYELRHEFLREAPPADIAEAEGASAQLEVTVSDGH